MIVKNHYLVLIGSRHVPGAISLTYFLMAVLALPLVSSLVVPSMAMPGDLSLIRSGLRNSPGTDKLSGEQLDRLVKSLREKTGFPELRFDEDGFLTLGDRTCIVGGSAAARALIAATVDGSGIILLKSRSPSSKVSFAYLTSSVYINTRTGARIQEHSLELDFYDFTQLLADREVIAAFDPGFAVLHELGHAVLGLQDDKTNERGLGNCEEYLNHIRRELGLPERQHYLAREQIFERVRISELLFVQRERGKLRHFYLRWETNIVGSSIEKARPAASPRRNSPLLAKQ